ncbi:hypothetical protein [Paenibacillus kobensis]|uniref:hypothetical protein n=1 Tax=Paenibacillus kobensis TaxID=59841 RepID=UPI000FD86CC5|nr:hypothetical protein [Paenibacillus kobensis]
MARKWLGVVLVVSFCFIAIFSRHETVKQTNGKVRLTEHRTSVVRYVNEEPEGGVELQLLKRDSERYNIYRTIDRPRQVEHALRVLKQADWMKAHVDMDRQPDYKIETIRADEPLTYDVWVTPRRNLEIVIEGKAKYVKLSDRTSRTLLDMFESQYESERDGQVEERRPRNNLDERNVEIER